MRLEGIIYVGDDWMGFVVISTFFSNLVSLDYNHQIHVEYQGICYILTLIYMYLYLNVASIITFFVDWRALLCWWLLNGFCCHKYLFSNLVSLGYNHQLHVEYQAICYILTLIYMYLYLNLASIVTHFLCLRTDSMRRQPLDFIPNDLLKLQC